MFFQHNSLFKQLFEKCLKNWRFLDLGFQTKKKLGLIVSGVLTVLKDERQTCESLGSVKKTISLNN